MDIEDVAQVVTRFYGHHRIESPGVAPEDLAQLLEPWGLIPTSWLTLDPT